MYVGVIEIEKGTGCRKGNYFPVLVVSLQLPNIESKKFFTYMINKLFLLQRQHMYLHKEAFTKLSWWNTSYLTPTIKLIPLNISLLRL